MNTLQAWINQNLDLRGNFPFDKIFDTVSAALADGILESSELSSMLQLFEKITDPVANRDACTDFIFTNKTFCLSGEFEYGEKSKVEALLIEKGAAPVKSVTKKTDYVLVGGKGNAAWCAGNYGTKVKKALELQEKGCPIQIVKEQDIVL